jgi:hypothetical protein
MWRVARGRFVDKKRVVTVMFLLCVISFLQSPLYSIRNTTTLSISQFNYNRDCRHLCLCEREEEGARYPFLFKKRSRPYGSEPRGVEGGGAVWKIHPQPLATRKEYLTPFFPRRAEETGLVWDLRCWDRFAVD